MHKIINSLINVAAWQLFLTAIGSLMEQQDVYEVKGLSVAKHPILQIKVYLLNN